MGTIVSCQRGHSRVTLVPPEATPVGRGSNDRRSSVEGQGWLERGQESLWATYLLCDLRQTPRPLRALASTLMSRGKSLWGVN